MKAPSLLTLAVGLTCIGIVQADQDSAPPRGEQAMILMGGAHCEECVAEVERALRKVPGIKLPEQRFTVGKKPNFHSEHMIVTIVDKELAYIGLLAEVVGKTKTPHQSDYPPSVNIVLHTTDRINEPFVQKLRDHLAAVNGLVVDQPGSLGGVPARGLLWIRLEKAGGAELSEVRKAVESLSKNIRLVEED